MLAERAGVSQDSLAEMSKVALLTWLVFIGLEQELAI